MRYAADSKEIHDGRDKATENASDCTTSWDQCCTLSTRPIKSEELNRSGKERAIDRAGP